MKPDGQRGRRQARALIGLAIGFGLATLFIVVTAPGSFEPMSLSLWAIAFLVAAVATYFIGLGWMVRIYRGHTEPGDRTWRYRDRDDTNRGPALKTTDGRRGRRIARGLIVLAVLYGLAILCLWVFLGRDFMEPTFGLSQSFGWVAVIVGVASYFLGIGWMIRIYRAQRETDERTWRYRR